jgi:hypothetical protein
MKITEQVNEPTYTIDVTRAELITIRDVLGKSPGIAPWYPLYQCIEDTIPFKEQA